MVRSKRLRTKISVTEKLVFIVLGSIGYMWFGPYGSFDPMTWQFYYSIGFMAINMLLTFFVIDRVFLKKNRDEENKQHS